MTERASLQLTSTTRGPPRRRRVPDAPVGGYHVGTANQSRTHELSLRDRLREIAIAISEIERLDKKMLQLADDMIPHQTKLNDPSTDAWDRIEIEETLGPLFEQYSDLRQSVEQRAVEISTHGAWLIGEWRDVDLMNIARHVSPDVIDRVLVECPGIETGEAWQLICREACPF